MNSFTSNYNFDLYDPDDKPNLCDQYNDAMNKIDNQFKVSEGNVQIAITNANNATAAINDVKTLVSNETTRAETAESDLQTNMNTLQSNTANDINTLTESIESLTDAYQADLNKVKNDLNDTQHDVNTNTNSINSLTSTINNKFPVKTSDIADNAITAAKLNASAMNAILENFDIRYFNSADAGADNDGMSVPNGGTLGGFYIVGMNILFINTLSWDNCPGITANTVYFTLPQYVPKPNARTTINSSGVLFYNGTATGADVRTFRGMSLNPNGGLSFNSTLNTSGISIFGVSSTVVYCGSFGTTYSAAGNAYTDAVNANGAL